MYQVENIFVTPLPKRIPSYLTFATPLSVPVWLWTLACTVSVFIILVIMQKVWSRASGEPDPPNYLFQGLTNSSILIACHKSFYLLPRVCHHNIYLDWRGCWRELGRKGLHSWQKVHASYLESIWSGHINGIQIRSSGQSYCDYIWKAPFHITRDSRFWFTDVSPSCMVPVSVWYWPKGINEEDWQ